MSDNLQRQLKKPFKADEIEWRINRKGFSSGNPWATAIPYITSRAVQDRLDEVFGIFGWKNEIQKVSDKGFLSGISIHHEGQWITKWDGAEGSTANGMDVIKSGASNALKRAAVLLGIGRYLYELEEFFVKTVISPGWNHAFGNVYKDSKNGNKLVAWQTPQLPPMALPDFDIETYINDMRLAINGQELDEAFLNAKKAAGLHGNGLMLEAAVKQGILKREEFKQAAALTIGEDTAEIKIYIDAQIKTFSLVPHVDSVESVCNTLLQELSNRTKNMMVDIEPFIEQINNSKNEQINKLTSEK